MKMTFYIFFFCAKFFFENLYICCNELKLKRLQTLQNKSRRTFFNCGRYTSIGEGLQFNTLSFMHKIKNGNAPEHLSNQIKYIVRNGSNADIEINKEKQMSNVCKLYKCK